MKSEQTKIKENAVQLINEKTFHFDPVQLKKSKKEQKCKILNTKIYE